MKSRKNTGQCSHQKTLKKIQKVQEFPLPYETLSSSQGKKAKRSPNHKCNAHEVTIIAQPQRPRSHRKSKGSQLVQQKWNAGNEDIFQGIGDLPFARPEKNNSGHFIQQRLRRKIGIASKKANQVKDCCRNNGLICHNSKQVLTLSDKQIHQMKKTRQESSSFLEGLDRYLDELDYRSDQYHQEQICENQQIEYRYHGMQGRINYGQAYRDARHEIIERLTEQRKEKEMIAYKIEMRDKKLKKMNQTAAHMLEYIRELKGEITITRQEKDEQIRALNNFVTYYESVRKGTAQQQNTYQCLPNHRIYDGYVDQARTRPFQERISSKQQSTKLKKRGLGNRNILNEHHFKRRGSNKGSAIDFYNYT